MKKKAVLVLPFLLMSAALADDHHTGLSENHPDAKIFRWAENHAGDCHEVGAVLAIDFAALMARGLVRGPLRST